MKKSLITLLAIGIAISLAGTGCKTKGKDSKPLTPLPGTGSTGGTGTGGTDTEVVPPIPGTGTGTTGTSITNPNNLPPQDGLNGMIPDREIFKGNTVLFEFDRSALQQKEQYKVQAVAKVLKERPNTKIQIEGHCDERGTEEYNRSLGDNRALAIREFLINLGIEGSRIYTLTFGEDKPAVQGHNEEAWTKNRRGEFILYSKP